MVKVAFTHHLDRHVNCPEKVVEATTVREALEKVFSDNDQLRTYVVDERWQLRQHVVIFIDGKMIVDRATQSDPINPDSDVYVMQALSGG